MVDREISGTNNKASTGRTVERSLNLTESNAEGALLRRRSAPNAWFEKCTRKLTAIANLQENWDSYGGRKPNSLSLNFAHAFLHFLRDRVNVPEPLIAANANGYVCFEWEDDVRTLTTEIDDSGVHHFYYCYGDEDELEGETRQMPEITGLLSKL